MTRRVLAAAAVGLSLACGPQPASFVIPGPSAPSSVVTEAPLVWDSAAEWRVWLENTVSTARATIVVEDGVEFVRVSVDTRAAVNGDVLRGPDLPLPLEAIRGARVRARLRHDRPRSPGSVQTESVQLVLDATNPIHPNMQPELHVDVQPGDTWQDLTLIPAVWCCPSPLVPRYAYLRFRGNTAWTMDIDRLELIR